MPGATTPCLPVAAPSNKITFTSTTYNRKKGTAKLSGEVSGPGQISIASTTDGGGKTCEADRLTLTANGPFSPPVKPKGKPGKALKKKGKAKLNVFVTYTPAGVAGVTNSDKRTLKLSKNVKKKKKEGIGGCYPEISGCGPARCPLSPEVETPLSRLERAAVRASRSRRPARRVRRLRRVRAGQGRRPASPTSGCTRSSTAARSRRGSPPARAG